MNIIVVKNGKFSDAAKRLLERYAESMFYLVRDDLLGPWGRPMPLAECPDRRASLEAVNEQIRRDGEGWVL